MYHVSYDNIYILFYIDGVLVSFEIVGIHKKSIRLK